MRGGGWRVEGGWPCMQSSRGLRESRGHCLAGDGLLLCKGCSGIKELTWESPEIEYRSYFFFLNWLSRNWFLFMLLQLFDHPSCPFSVIGRVSIMVRTDHLSAHTLNLSFYINLKLLFFSYSLFSCRAQLCRIKPFRCGFSFGGRFTFSS